MILNKPFLCYHATLLDTPPTSPDNILGIMDMLGLKIVSVVILLHQLIPDSRLVNSPEMEIL